MIDLPARPDRSGGNSSGGNSSGVLSLRRQRGGTAESGFRLLSMGAGLLVLVILALIAIATAVDAWPVFRQEGLGFLTSKRWAPSENAFGALAFVWGTLAVSAIALIIAVPISLGIALFLTEVAPARIVKPVVFLLDLLAAVPSVVFGLWGLFFMRKYFNSVAQAISNTVGQVPGLRAIFGGDVKGNSLGLAGVVLALMIVPIVTSLAREVLNTVPSAQREGALALGATRWEMIRGAVLPYGKSGLVGAVMLGLGRAMGETIAAALLIGSTPQLAIKLFAPADAMPAVIANEFGEASGTWRSGLIALGLTLFAMTILVNGIARSILARGSKAARS